MRARAIRRPSTANFDHIVERLRGGENIAVVEGPDDICRPWLGEPMAHCRRDSITLRDRDAAEDLSTLLGVPVAEMTALPDLAILRAAFAKGATRSACRGCEWFDLCGGIAANGFGGTRLPGPRPNPHPNLRAEIMQKSCRKGLAWARALK